MPSLGLGACPLGVGPYGLGTPPEPTEPITTAVTCRAIDPVKRDYVTDADGNPVAQDGTANRVYLLLAYADVPSDIITPQGLAQREAAIRAALATLTGGPSPAIAKLTVRLTDDGGGAVSGTVSYLNLDTQQPETVQIP